jgi:hypothetical protein
MYLPTAIAEAQTRASSGGSQEDIYHLHSKALDPNARNLLHRFCPSGKSGRFYDCGVSSPLAKIFLFFRNANQSM